MLGGTTEDVMRIATLCGIWLAAIVWAILAGVTTVPFALPVAHATASQEGNWTVVAMAPDGAWGLATEPSVGQAIAEAIRRCKAMSRAEIGCGAQLRVIRAGWIVAYRCGDENIIAAERSLADAEQAARKREIKLRVSYVRDLPSRRHVLTVDPSGEALVTKPQQPPAQLDQD
jgi:hypothetical protein